VGCNAVCPETLDYLEQLEGRDDVPGIQTFVHETNIYKYPLMAEMFRDLDTHWTAWFDDDSLATGPWFESIEKSAEDDTDVACWGKIYRFKLRGHQERWAREATWYRGRPLGTRPPGSRYREVRFCVGGFWVIKTRVIHEIGWPDRRIRHNGGDIFLGAALEQNGYNIGSSYEHVCIDTEKRRGYSEPPIGIRREDSGRVLGDAKKRESGGL